MSEGIDNLKRIVKSIYLRPVRRVAIQAFGSRLYGAIRPYLKRLATFSRYLIGREGRCQRVKALRRKKGIMGSQSIFHPELNRSFTNPWFRNKIHQHSKILPANALTL